MLFHPLIAEWFTSSVGTPTNVQVQDWPAIQSGEDVLIAAPTGSGKTFAAFLSCIDHLFTRALARELDDHTHGALHLAAYSTEKQRAAESIEAVGRNWPAVLWAGLLMLELRITCGLDRCGSLYLLWPRMSWWSSILPCSYPHPKHIDSSPVAGVGA